jgi:hypothetical protein
LNIHAYAELIFEPSLGIFKPSAEYYVTGVIFASR